MAVYSCVISGCENVAVYSEGQCVMLTWHVYMLSRVVKVMVGESPLTSIDLSYDGVTLAVGSTRGKIYIYDLRLGSTPVNVVSAHKSSVQCLKFQNNTRPQKVIHQCHILVHKERKTWLETATSQLANG